jgi:hypothetical protein
MHTNIHLQSCSQSVHLFNFLSLFSLALSSFSLSFSVSLVFSLSLSLYLSFSYYYLSFFISLANIYAHTYIHTRYFFSLALSLNQTQIYSHGISLSFLSLSLPFFSLFLSHFLSLTFWQTNPHSNLCYTFIFHEKIGTLGLTFYLFEGFNIFNSPSPFFSLPI